MKILFLIVMIAVITVAITGCATQKELQMQKWNVEYLQKALESYKQDNNAIREQATQYIQENERANKIKSALINELILATEISVADSLLKKHGMKYTFKDGRVIGKKQ